MRAVSASTPYPATSSAANMPSRERKSPNSSCRFSTSCRTAPPPKRVEPLPRFGERGFRLRHRGDRGKALQHRGNAFEALARIIPIAHDDELLIGPELCRVRVLLQESDEPGRIGEAIGVEGDRRALLASLDLLDAGIAAEPLDRDDLQEIVDLLRQRTEAID